MKRKRLAWGVALLTVFAFAFQGSRGLWEPDEGRYTAVAAQMLRTGDFLFPALNDLRPHFTKPPLSYWAIAAGVSLFGANPWGARALNGAAYVLTVLLVLALGHGLQPRRPWLPALVFASLLLPYLAATIPNCDTLLALFETAAMAAFVRWWNAPEPRSRRYLVLMWAAYGLAFLTKGPPGLLPLAASLVFLAAIGERGRIRALFPALGLAAFAALGLAWYVAVIAARPGLLTYFLRSEVFDRVFSGVHDRHAEWYGGITTYVPVLVAGALPWSVALLRRVGAARAVLDRGWWRTAARERPALVLALVWLLVPLAVFLVSRSRLPLYVLPLAVPIALLAAAAIGDRAPLTRGATAGLVAWFVVLVALRAAASMVPSERDSRPLARALGACCAPVRHVVFVQARPRWGVALPLGAEVEAVAFAPGPGWADLTVDAELRRDRENVVYVVPDAALERFAAAGRTVHREVRTVARLGTLCLVRVAAGP